MSQNANPLLTSIDKLLGALSSLDPVECGQQVATNAKRSVEALVSAVENFSATLENLNKTTQRINAILDEVEQPLRQAMPKINQGLQTLSSLGEATAALNELAKGIGPLTALAENAGFLFGMKPKQPGAETPPATPNANPE